MKVGRIVLLLLLVAVTALVVAARLRPTADASLDLVLVATTEVSLPLEESVLSAEPSAPVAAPQLIEAPVAVAEPKQPVQPLKERGDAMLFESDALFGTPFDQAIVMPFD